MSLDNKPFCPCKKLVAEFTRRFRIANQCRDIAITPVEASSDDGADAFALSKPDARESVHHQTRLLPLEFIKYYEQLEPSVKHIVKPYSYHVLEVFKECVLVPEQHRHELVHSKKNLSISGLCSSIQRAVQQNSRVNRNKLEYNSDGRLLSLPATRVFMPLTLASQGLKLPRNGEHIKHVSFRVRILQGIYYGVNCKGENCHYVTIYHESDLAVSDTLRASMQNIQLECTVDNVPTSVVIETGTPIWEAREAYMTNMPAPMPRHSGLQEKKSGKNGKDEKEDEKEEDWSLTGREMWADSGDPLAPKRMYGQFGSEQPGKYLIGFGSKHEEKSAIANRQRKLRPKTVLTEVVSGDFIDNYIPSANRQAGPLFAPDIVLQMEEKYKSKSSHSTNPFPSLSTSVMDDKKSYPTEDVTLFLETSPDTVLIIQSCQAFKDFKVQGGQLPDLQPGTIVQCTPEKDELYFQWHFTHTLSVPNTLDQKIIHVTGWSLKRHAIYVATSAHPESKWFITQPRVKIYSEPVEDETKQYQYQLRLAQIIQQVGRLHDGWIRHALGYSRWQKNMVPMGDSLMMDRKPQPPSTSSAEPTLGLDILVESSPFSDPVPLFV